MEEKWIRILLIALTGVLAVLLIFVFAQYRALQQEQLVGARQLRAALFLEHHAPLPVSFASTIRTWMTFDYVNKLFALPPQYLENQLGIAVSSSYPRTTISNYAKSIQLDPAIFLNKVEDAVRMYMPISTPTSTSAGPPFRTHA